MQARLAHAAADSAASDRGRRNRDCAGPARAQVSAQAAVRRTHFEREDALGGVEAHVMIVHWSVHLQPADDCFLSQEDAWLTSR